ncbi:DUF6879 family protein [Amycolatopsis sp. NPDC023774]|uniref:DUF6879 family protein n=1 Tax=Amycolatopsis sp. NPDC023774 TaxID=3155015 RepID=UPI0033FFEC13
MTGEELDELYRTFTRYAWRLEARDVYGVPEENARLQAWLAGRELPRSDSKDAWKELTGVAAAAGRPFARVRMIGRPLTDYTRWEHSIYPDNLSAGEDVRLLERSWLTAEDAANPLWNVDFWLFDDRVAVVQNYADDGSYLGPELAPDPAPYVALRARALELSVPYAEFSLLPDQRSDDQQIRESEAARID